MTTSSTAAVTARLPALFAAIDRQDAVGFGAFLTDDVLFRFGNADPVAGRAATVAAVESFFGTIAALQHRKIAFWDAGDAVVAEMEVEYTRLDGKAVTVPAVTIFRTAGDQISDYRIFVDQTPVYAT
jgi:ketosteroid isomerase-like protein